MLNLIALVVLLVLCAAAIWLMVVVGGLPGKLAEQANHPQAEAIRLLGWVGLLAGGIGWFVALVWAKVRPAAGDRELERRIIEVEQKLEALEQSP